MVPATDTYMKSFPVLSQMSEGEDGGRKRERGGGGGGVATGGRFLMVVLPCPEEGWDGERSQALFTPHFTTELQSTGVELTG